MSLVETLAELVNIPSVTGSEDRIAQWIAGRYEDRYPVTRIGKSVIVGGRPGDAFVALYGHTDTVPVQGDPSARLEDGRLYGLGASDMKAGLAVMMELLDVGVREQTGGLVCVFYDAEEGPQDANGLGAVLDGTPWLTSADLSIVMEPTDLHLEFGCNGVVNADVVFIGATAHSARPWMGENAVTKAGEWLVSMHQLEPVVHEIDGLEFREVFSVTQAHGGIANNIIPGEFTVNLNYRFPPTLTIEEAVERLRLVAAPADRVVITDTAPPGRVDTANPELQRLEHLVARPRTAKQGWTDVARITERGAVAVNYGPGEVAQAHQVDESVPIENLETAYDVLHTFLA